MLEKRNGVKKKRRMGRLKGQLLLDGSLGIFPDLATKMRYMYIQLVRDLDMWTNWYKYQEFIEKHNMKTFKTTISNMVGQTQTARYERKELRKAKYGSGPLFQYIRNMVFRVREKTAKMGVERTISVQIFKGKSPTVRMSGMNYKDLSASTDIVLYVPIVDEDRKKYDFMTDRSLDGMVKYQGNLEVTIPIKNLIDTLEFRKDGSIHRTNTRKEWVDLKRVRL